MEHLVKKVIKAPTAKSHGNADELGHAYNPVLTETISVDCDDPFFRVSPAEASGEGYVVPKE